ncbi:hypothetical protein LV84_04229 [Algoriphagus ratkowskyi]|uniref:Uncharacterized protein n=1 Tax=Algoriphagus ratkowskyi TaxID=57028 RepID=A0A2W7QM59_9BACT|nr:hypothetical protein [Algoriphagus ratkowskyi]PZX49543.1 hypothetical protein LV84_04229 [Algoriphagus ratkowskyi]TXD75410.1 hypothetical protein ESW18_20565 [Algoriphagus ratkowskyi]
MTTLPRNWITEGLIDFEYKKYQLMAYLQETNKHFNQLKLYPVLSDLIDRHHDLKELESGKMELTELFPKRLDSIDFQRGQLNYQAKLSDDGVMKELSLITEFALPKLVAQIEEGRMIYDFVEKQLEFEPVGIIPIYNQEGYILMSREKKNEVHAYRYKSSLLHFAGENFRSISMWLIGVFQRSIVNTLEKIKMDLIREIKELPNPATWRIHSQQEFPIEETLIPISKRLLLKSVTV